MEYPLLQSIETTWLNEAGVKLALLRLDSIDSQVSGNKAYKLAGYLEQVRNSCATGLISLGGAHSNHLHALAAVGYRLGLSTVGLLRGEAQLTPTVQDLTRWGMQLHWLGYGGYRARHHSSFWNEWLSHYPDHIPVPEGGSGWRGAKGCISLIETLQQQLSSLGWDDYDALWVAVGTGTTLAGLVVGEQGRHPVTGALAVPLDHGAQVSISRCLEESGVVDAGYKLLDASRGGFARLDVALARFLTTFEAETGVPLEPLYTGKMLLALQETIEAGHISAGQRIIAVHTGGLQGRRALAARIHQLAQ
ncbi:1-aminocyclopropane-1-carboxylate deaminase [Pseudomonas duriflava]|uniref:1-aminocyclopropane-1-carboxylate deaminase n=1 Tax=Pseudomonas duriflava TaxID=459528 RepID=A0A562Q8K7_9PSED|nr:pyridoxal-phosphate dependent enzyme [Pseudomonas duriflava]TWI53101.1 1-aminocyclopropane-1-carboxylate deaminase [Pseudomonas duriflava]